MTPWLIPALMVAGGLLGRSTAKPKVEKETIKQEPMYTPEQKSAMSMLLNVARSGKYGDFTFGEPYTGKMGEYGMTPTETAGQNRLLSLVGKDVTMPDLYGAGAGEIKSLLGTGKYDPYSEKGVFSGFKRNVLKEAHEAQGRLAQTKAITGSLYSRDFGRQSRKLQEETGQQLSDKLAELYDTFAQRKLSGSQLALTAGLDEARTKEAMETGRIRLSQQFGGLDRVLKDKEAKDVYEAWLRQREERVKPLVYAGGVAGASVPYSAKEMPVTTVTPSPWQNFFDTVTGVGSNLLGMYMYKNVF